jgi:iron-sulfur cluster assembly accessory protein
MITLTDKAIQAVIRFIDNSGKPVAGLRILIRGGGCSGLQYGLRLEESVSSDDNIIECGVIKVLVDPMSVALLEGVKVDFIETIDGAGFKFENPNALSSCACGQSFSA